MDRQSRQYDVHTDPVRVMVVDDDPFVREVTAAALGALDADLAIRAYDGGDAAIADLANFEPAVVILDLMMPAMDGRALWETLRRRVTSKPVLIFLTAHDDPQDREGLMALGAAGVIAKPFAPMAMAETVARLAGLIGGGARSRGVDAVAAEFRASLPEAAATFRANWEVLSRSWDAVAAETMLAQAHRLAGAAGLFRFHAVGAAADELEGLLRPHVKSRTTPSGADSSKIEAAVLAAIAACEAARQGEAGNAASESDGN